MANQNRCRAVRSGTDTASRPIVVFVHGFLDAAKVWETVQARLGAAGISTRALDLPGMGGTPSDSASISLDSYADAVGSVVKTLGAPVTLVGHSMGAQVAELVALRYADLVEGIVLVTPVPLAGVRAPAEIQTSTSLETTSGATPTPNCARRSRSGGQDQPAVIAGILMVRPQAVTRDGFC